MNAGELLLRNGKGIALAVALLIAAGLLSAAALPRGLYPELAFPRVVVVATVPDATTEIVFGSVTRPLEEALTPVLGVRRVRSKTLRGATEISLQFDADADMTVALQLVQARLAEVRGDLPAGTSVVAERLTPTSFPVLTLNLDGAPPERLRDVALHQVRPALSRVAGVGPISVTAGEAREIEVEVDPGRAEAAGLTVEEAARRVDAENRVQVAGRLDRAYRRYVIAIDGRAADPAALREMVVGGGERAPVRLGDIARIGEGHSDPRLLVRSPAGPAVMVNVARRVGGDVVSLDASLRVAIAQLQREVPAGVTLTPVYEQAGLIGAATGAVRDAILIGALLSSLILLAFLRDWRATAIAALAIPSSLVAACAVLRVFHGSLNLMSLGGMAIAVGLVIDDAVVLVEAIHREVRAGLAPRAAAATAVTALAGPVLSSTLTTVVVFAPLGLLSGVVGAFFAALSLALAAAVVLSLVISLTVIPLIAAWLLAPRAVEARQGLADRYAGSLRWTLSRRWWVLGAAAAVTALAAAGGRALETGFIPEMDEGSYVIDYYTPIGTSLAEADALAGGIDALLRADPDVETFSRRLGAELGPPAATDTSRGDYIVRLRAHRASTVFEIMERQRAALAAGVPGVRVEFIQILQDMLGDLEGNPEPIEVKLFGPDQDELRRQAKRAAEAIADVPGLVDLYDGQVACSPERRVRIDPIAAGRSGLSVEAIAGQLAADLIGAEVAPLPEQDRLVPIRVRWPDGARFSERVLDRARIRTPAGALVPLVELARIDDRCTPSEVTRENLRLMVPVTARLEGTDLGSATAEVAARLAKLELPRGVSLEVGGQRLSQQESFGALAVALGVALALVMLVLVFQFRGFAAPVAILAAIPVGLAGGVGALLATGTALNVSSLLGAILLVGLVVKNGILLLQRAAHGEQRGEPIADALAEAGRVRLRPILMTTLCTVVGLVPLALGLGAGAEMHRPLAIAVLGGLTLSTVGTLFVVPALYALLRARRGADRGV